MSLVAIICHDIATDSATFARPSFTVNNYFCKHKKATVISVVKVATVKFHLVDATKANLQRVGVHNVFEIVLLKKLNPNT
jgi:hypothetical protein